jgi:hypothetical protein
VPPAAPYLLAVLGADAGWVRDVIDGCRAAFSSLLGRTDGVTVTESVPPAGDPADEPPHALALFLADDASRADAALLEQVGRARDQLIPILPVVRPGADIFAVLPEVLRPLNAAAWERDGAAVTGAVARLLGLAETERRLFLSYRRLETSSLALQLRERLSQRSYDVFLDRFSVPPAADFQHCIDVELADKAFVLLLESPSAVGSQWVQHEVAYALSHGLSLLALCLPETVETQQFPSVDEAFRLRLAAEDLEAAADPAGPDARVLCAEALDHVLDEIESRYARQLRRRRTALLGSLAEWLQRAQREPRPVRDEWALAASHPGGVFMITPRAPTPANLRALDGLRAEHPDGRAVDGHLLFAAPVQDPEAARLIEWVVDRRPLEVHPYVSAPELLGL